MDIETAKAKLAATMLESQDDLYTPKMQCASCSAPKSGAATLRVCSSCRCVSYCSVDCQRAHWKSGHKQVCKQRQELSVIMGGKMALDEDGARKYVQSITEDRIAATLAVEKDKGASEERAGLMKWMEDTVALKHADIAKLALTFRKQLDKEGCGRNSSGDVYMRDGAYTLLMDFKCEDQPPAPSPLMDRTEAGGVGFGYASTDDMVRNPKLAAIVNRVDPRLHFVIIPQTRRSGGKTLFNVGAYDGSTVLVTDSGALMHIKSGPKMTVELGGSGGKKKKGKKKK